MFQQDTNEKKIKYFHPTCTCPVRQVISRLGDKWTMLVLVTLESNGTMRFSELQKAIGDISQRMLAVTLRSLEADGFVGRVVYPEVPPRVEYSITDMGLSLMPHLQNLIGWAVDNFNDITEQRERFLQASR